MYDVEYTEVTKNDLGFKETLYVDNDDAAERISVGKHQLY